ncbi:hypothetical protein GmHk_07G019164 [Glycine max]|nr:hypothetical protein GmHk_07G019164 [Glycine max]
MFLKSRSQIRDSSLMQIILFFKKHLLSSWNIDQVWCGHRGTLRIAPVSQGNSRCYPSRDKGARRRGGTKSCFT